MADEINKKQPIDKEYLITSLKDLDKHILSKKYNKIISPINFRGYINTTYDGSEEITVTFPDTEVLNQTAGTPVGEIISYMGKNAPPNYLICDGTEYNIADYPYLTQHFIDNFGSVNYFGGDGETTFAVPDLRGEFLRGSGNNSRPNQGNGADVGVHQDATKISNVGTFYSSNTNYWMGGMVGANSVNPFNLNNSFDTKGGNAIGLTTSRQGIDTNSANNPMWYTSRPTNTAVLYCIKYKPTHFAATKHMYSYQEQRVGTWIDGKPLYEKAFDYGTLPNNSRIEKPHGIANIDGIWFYEGFVLNPSTYGHYPISVKSRITAWYPEVNKTGVAFNAESDLSYASALVILRYTKTTD